MSPANTMSMLDIGIFIIGIWMMFNAVTMRKNGTIPSMLLTPEEQKKVKDTAGFINAVYSRFLVFAILMTVLGGIAVISDFMIKIPYINYIEFAGFLIGVVYFYKAYQDARVKYIN